MPSWGKFGEGRWKSCLRPGVLCTVSTVSLNYLTSQAFFVRFFYTLLNSELPAYAQSLYSRFTLLSGWFSTLSTGPIKETRLIKDLI